jgi:hypothetical protein
MNMKLDKIQGALMAFVVGLLTILQQSGSGLAMLIITILIVALSITPAIMMFSKKVFWIFWLFVGIGVSVVALKFFYML